MVADVWQPFPNGIQIQRPLLPSDALELYIVKDGMLYWGNTIVSLAFELFYNICS